MMRFATIFAVITMCGAGTALAQTPSVALAPDRGYGEFTGGMTFGNKTAGSFGGELGYWVTDSLGVFIEGGRMTNVVTNDITARAQQVAAFIGGSANATQKANYVDLGVIYRLHASGRLRPYVVAGLGDARLIRASTFSVGGTDVTSQLLDTYGVALGTDLSGHVDKLLVTAGFGAHVRLTDRLMGDLSYRYSHIGKDTDTQLPAVNTNRLQFGIGVRF